MIIQWNGQTPYDGYRRVLESDRNDDPGLLGRADGLVEGYRAAMNSRVVALAIDACRLVAREVPKRYTRGDYLAILAILARHAAAAVAAYEAQEEKP